MEGIEWIGTVAGALTTLSFFPQVAKTWAARSADGFSWAWLIAFGSGLVLWLAYGFAKGAPSLVIANGVTAALVAVIIYVKLGSRSVRADGA